jgi:glycosyltransferase involved in cell wall biosynthesis
VLSRDRRGPAQARHGGNLGVQVDVDVARVECDAVRDELIFVGVPDDRVVVAHACVDLQRFVPGCAPRGSASPSWARSRSGKKGVDVLAELARAGAERRSRGGGWARVPLVPAPRLRSSGADHDDVAALLSTAHALVLPSASDGFGYVVLEGMACGAIPLISTEVGAAEVVR